MKITISCIQFSLSLDLIIFFWILILNNVYLIGDKGIPRGGGFSPCIMVYRYVPRFLGAFQQFWSFQNSESAQFFKLDVFLKFSPKKHPYKVKVNENITYTYRVKSYVAICFYFVIRQRFLCCNMAKNATQVDICVASCEAFCYLLLANSYPVYKANKQTPQHTNKQINKQISTLFYK